MIESNYSESHACVCITSAKSTGRYTQNTEQAHDQPVGGECGQCEVCVYERVPRAATQMTEKRADII